MLPGDRKRSASAPRFTCCEEDQDNIVSDSHKRNKLSTEDTVIVTERTTNQISLGDHILDDDISTNTEHNLGIQPEVNFVSQPPVDIDNVNTVTFENIETSPRNIQKSIQGPKVIATSAKSPYGNVKKQKKTLEQQTENREKNKGLTYAKVLATQGRLTDGNIISAKNAMQTVPNLIQPGSAPVISQKTKPKRQLRASSRNLTHIQQNVDTSNLHIQPITDRNNAQRPVHVMNSMYPQQPVKANEVDNTGNVQFPTTQTSWPQHILQQTTTELEVSTDDSSSSDDDDDLNQLGSRHIQIINSTGMPAESILSPSISICRTNFNIHFIAPRAGSGLRIGQTYPLRDVRAV